MSRPNARYLDLLQCVMNYTVMFELLCNVQLLKSRASELAHNIQSSCSVQDTNLSTGCRYPASDGFFQGRRTSSGYFQNRASQNVEAIGWCFYISALQPNFHTLKRVGTSDRICRQLHYGTLYFLHLSTCCTTITSRRRCVLHTTDR